MWLVLNMCSAKFDFTSGCVSDFSVSCFGRSRIYDIEFEPVLTFKSG